MTGASVVMDDVHLCLGTKDFRFDLALAGGETCAVLGPSGSGKSTLLGLLAGFVKPQSGRVLIDGADVTSAPPGRRPVSMIFQDYNLFAHLDVWMNVALGVDPTGKLDKAQTGAVELALESVGLAGMKARLPGDLSGGERQRVALARCLVRDRPVLLLDEALTALGPALRDNVMDLIRQAHSDRGMTILMVSHDPADALALCDRAVFLDDGRIVASGPTGSVLADDKLAAYLGTSR